MKGKALITLLLFSITYSFGQSSPKFSKREVIEDLEYLYASLKATNYNLFAYTSEQAFDVAYQETLRSLDKDSLGRLETTKVFQRFVAVADIGHTGLDFPIPAYSEYATSGGTLFPLEVAFESNRPLIRKNWSDNDSIKIGMEIVSINGRPMNEVLGEIYPLISAERPYFKQAKVELYSFPRYYWFAFGRQDEFEVELSHEGIVKAYSLRAVDLIEGFEMKRSEVLNASMQLKFYEQTAYLNTGNLSGDEPQFQHFIDSAFVSIKEKGSKNLIIDLRNNGGGDNSFSDYVVSYFADQPFRWHDSYSFKTSALLKTHVRENYDTTDVFWQEVLNREDGEVYEYEFGEYQPQAPENRFTGKVYVLVNRQSHSQSTMMAAQIQDYGFGTIVGEETSECPSLYASIFQIALPNTGLSVNVSKGYMVRVNGSTKEEGVIPDIFIKDYLLDEDDEVLDGLLEKIAAGL